MTPRREEGRRHAVASVVKRWELLDYQLCMGFRGARPVKPAEFAKSVGVDLRTIQRDRKAIESLGYKILSVDEAGYLPMFVNEHWSDFYYWRYPFDQQPMFALAQRALIAHKRRKTEKNRKDQTEAALFDAIYEYSLDPTGF